MYAIPAERRPPRNSSAYLGPGREVLRLRSFRGAALKPLEKTNGRNFDPFTRGGAEKRAGAGGGDRTPHHTTPPRGKEIDH